MAEEDGHMCGVINFFKRAFGVGGKVRPESHVVQNAPNKGKALIHAINDYPDAPLQGCVQDASTMQLLWSETLGIDPSCIKMLLNKDANTANIKDSLKWLSEVQSGEFALYHFSGHGVQVPGREQDNLDECVCPYDFDWSPSRMITDDDYFKIFWEMPDDVRFYWSSDSCHSGDLSRDIAPVKGRNRSMPLPPHMVSLVAKLKSRNLIKPLLSKRRAQELDVGYVSACLSTQTASDTVINGKPCGAFTYFFADALKKTPKDPLVMIVERTVQGLRNNYYSQEPQGDGPRIKFSYSS